MSSIQIAPVALDPVQVEAALAALRTQLADPAQARVLLGIVSLGNLVQLAGLPELVDNEELLGWLLTTADAIRENPQLRPQMQAIGRELSEGAQELVASQAD